jgi:hypothetical protein
MTFLLHFIAFLLQSLLLSMISVKGYSGDMTFYAVGLGACGWTNGNSEMIVAMVNFFF